MNNVITQAPVKGHEGYSVYQANYGRRRAGVMAHGYHLPEEVNYGPAAILDLSPDANELMVYLQEKKAS